MPKAAKIIPLAKMACFQPAGGRRKIIPNVTLRRSKGFMIVISRVWFDDPRYYAKSDPADVEDLMSTTSQFTARNSETNLQLTHTGIPERADADAYLGACTLAWVASLNILPILVDTVLNT